MVLGFLFLSFYSLCVGVLIGTQTLKLIRIPKSSLEYYIGHDNVRGIIRNIQEARKSFDIENGSNNYISNYGNTTILMRNAQESGRTDDENNGRSNASSIIRNNPRSRQESARQTCDNSNNTTNIKRMFVLADVVDLRGWTGVTLTSDRWSFMKPVAGSNKTLYRGLYNCTRRDSEGIVCNCTIELTIGNDTRQMAGKDAVIVNWVPRTLKAKYNAVVEGSSSRQLLLFFSMETPLMAHRINSKYANLKVHAVWSYHRDNQLSMPYGIYQPGVPMKHIRTESKTKLMAWASSNCLDIFWPRIDFVKELQKHIKLDTYGKCGNLKCPRFNAECDQLMQSYKFYLSAENAECEDYITEKLWHNAFRRGAIPVVYGARKKDYKDLAPPNSFIYAGDFNNISSLAQYIIKVDQSPELYEKYFEWRKQGSLTVTKGANLTPNKLCDVLPLIDQLKNGDLEKKPVSSFPWFNTCKFDPFKFKTFSTLREWKAW